ncbi:MAG: hypothetical protein FD143_3658, partial [Ignavibacteria bacterium]
VFFIYILVVYKEYIIKSSKFTIRKISRVRVPPWVFRGHFLHPSKSTLRIDGPVSFFYGTLPYSLRASMPNMGAIACSLGALAWGHQNGGDSKRPTCDTCSATGHHEDNSLQHRKGMMTLGRK